MTMMTAPQTAGELAEMAAESIRTLNHATLPGTARSNVPDVYRITADLSSLSHRLSQACDQLAAILVDRLDLGGLRADDGTDPALRIFEAQAELREAHTLASDLGTRLQRVQNLVSIISDGGE